MTADNRQYISIEGARLHNLKNIDLKIPRNKLVVITGLSGSGKSSLAFDTLYAEGQRRYVESLSSYARQFMGKLEKPDVDNIRGLSPTIAIQQKVNTSNPRSTVGSSTEIYDYLKLLFSRIGKTISPISGKQVQKHTVTNVVDAILEMNQGDKFLLCAPFHTDRDFDIFKSSLLGQGYARLWIDGETISTDDLAIKDLKKDNKFIIIDRLVVESSETFKKRLADSVQQTFHEGEGILEIKNISSGENFTFSNKFELDGILFQEPNIHFFSFNSPFGACPTCEGFGKTIGLDHSLIIPIHTKSLFEDAIVCWKTDSGKAWKDALFNTGLPIHRAYQDLSEEEIDIVWNGSGAYKGLNAYFEELENSSYKIQNRVTLSRYRGKTTCPDCQGKKLRKETDYVQVGGTNLGSLSELPLDELSQFFDEIVLDTYSQEVAKRLLYEIKSRLGFLIDVGLSYLTLSRLSNSLSGGESQRINLATSLGSSLVGSVYILDEPSIGLHSKDTEKLITVLKKLRDIGNTVIVVEHDEDIMMAADYIIDIGPEAGTNGGEIVFTGTFDELPKSERSYTAKYLTGKESIKVPEVRRQAIDYVYVKGASENNLKQVDITIPMGCFTAVSGVSGSGKSSLIKDVLYPAIHRQLGGYGHKIGEHESVHGAISRIQNVEFVDQNPIGKSSRSNPVTYIKAFDDIRNLLASQSLAVQRAYKAKHFSFNVPGGRCENCQGEGIVTIEMQFMADIHITCEHCKGHRYQDQILDIKFEGKNIFDILELTVENAYEFFEKHDQKKIVNKLYPLLQVGLGYVKLGQASSTLSGGEAQRIKLASFLSKSGSHDHTLFIFDEPTTGLHFHDVKKLLKSFDALLEKGHSLIVIEHNLDVLKCADWIIDLGPEGGKKGGELLFQGVPEKLTEVKESQTARYLKDKL